MTRVPRGDAFPIPFNRPSFPPSAWTYVEEAIAAGMTGGDGPLGREAESVLSSIHRGAHALLTTSGTHALELGARLMDLRPGDEVIVPAFTFVSTASAFVWNGANPVLADVREDTLNLDPRSVERMVGPRTRGICLVHYGGVAADPDWFADFAESHGIVLFEDNAHGLSATFGDRPLGTFGALSALSFHETKNVNCGEGGALIINDDSLVERARILRDKGTNRAQFREGLVDKYTWVDVGSSWVMSDILAAVLLSQLERIDGIQHRRSAIWTRYEDGLRDWAERTGVLMPTVPPGSTHPAHMFHLRLADRFSRDAFIAHMQDAGVLCVFHYQSLAASTAARDLQLRADVTVNSRRAADTLVRLPLYDTLTDDEIDRVVSAACRFRA